MVRFAREKLVLRFLGPVMAAPGLVAEFRRVLVVLALHFLQKHHLRIEHADGFLQRNHPRRGADGGDALVDVVGSDTNLHGNILTAKAARYASRLNCARPLRYPPADAAASAAPGLQTRPCAGAGGTSPPPRRERWRPARSPAPGPPAPALPARRGSPARP